MKRTVFLGAGASCDAGYPLTSQLYDYLERYYSRRSDYSEWKKFTAFLKHQRWVIQQADNTIKDEKWKKERGY